MKKALLIGINYNKTSRQINCEIDSHLFQDYLEDFNICSMVESSTIPRNIPTKENILFQFNELIKCNPDDTLLFYFAGHGGNVYINGNKYECIYPIDGYILSKELIEIIKNVKCKAFYFIFDSCNSNLILNNFNICLSSIILFTNNLGAESKRGGLFTYSIIETLKKFKIINQIPTIQSFLLNLNFFIQMNNFNFNSFIISNKNNNLQIHL
jgi:hypothetical protein